MMMWVKLTAAETRQDTDTRHTEQRRAVITFLITFASLVLPIIQESAV